MTLINLFLPYQQFKKNNINLTNIQIKNLLQTIRENEYPSDDKFLNDITKITISFGDNIELQNLPICFEYNKYLYYKKKKFEKYIIFSSAFQLQSIKKCSQIYIDATYKSCPKSFYQLLNIAGYIPDIKGLVPLFMIPMSSKNQYLYDKIFKNGRKWNYSKGYNK